jgi:hypothetical protein
MTALSVMTALSAIPALSVMTALSAMPAGLSAAPSSP